MVQWGLELARLEIEGRFGDVIFSVGAFQFRFAVFAVDLPLEIVKKVGGKNVSVDAELQSANFKPEIFS